MYSKVKFVLTLIAGFLGWTLVQTYHVGVDPLKQENEKTGRPI